MAAMNKAQEFNDGEVRLQLFKGNVIIKGRSSPFSRYNQDIASMDIAGGYDPTGTALCAMQLTLPLEVVEVVLSPMHSCVCCLSSPDPRRSLRCAGFHPLQFASSQGSPISLGPRGSARA